MSESECVTVAQSERTPTWPGWLREVGAAVGAILGWVAWTFALQVTLLLVTWPFRGWLLGVGLPAPVGFVLYLCGAAIVAVWPLLVSARSRFGRWTWVWGGVNGVLGVVVGVLEALRVIPAQAPAHGSLFYPHLSVADIAVYQGVFFAAIVAYWFIDARRRA